MPTSGHNRPGHRPSPVEELRDALDNPANAAPLLGAVVSALEPAQIRRLADLINGAKVSTLRAYARTVEIESSRIRTGQVRAITGERFGEVTHRG